MGWPKLAGLGAVGNERRAGRMPCEVLSGGLTTLGAGKGRGESKMGLIGTFDNVIGVRGTVALVAMIFSKNGT